MGRFAVDSKHAHFYREYGFVEFEKLIDEERRELLLDAVQQCLAKRMACQVGQLHSQQIDKLLAHGRDLWREQKLVKQSVHSKGFAEIASQLSSSRQLALAYDQVLQHGRHFQTRYLQEPSSIEDLSSCRGVQSALILNLSGHSGEAAPTPEDFVPAKGCNVFTQVPCSGVFVSPQLRINWEPFLASTKAVYLLVVYASDRARYFKNRQDWAGGAWMDLGYANGDALDQSQHPMLWRGDS